MLESFEARPIAADARGVRIVEVVRGGDRKTRIDGEFFDPAAVTGEAEPKRIAIVGEHEIERAISLAVDVGQGVRRGLGIGVIERLEDQLAARPLARRRPERPRSVEDTGQYAVIVEPEPGAAGLEVLAGNDVAAVGPMAVRRQPRPINHFIAVGTNDDRPVMIGASEENQGAHGLAGLAFGDGEGSKRRWDLQYVRRSAARPEP